MVLVGFAAHTFRGFRSTKLWNPELVTEWEWINRGGQKNKKKTSSETVKAIAMHNNNCWKFEVQYITFYGYLDKNFTLWLTDDEWDYGLRWIWMYADFGRTLFVRQMPIISVCQVPMDNVLCIDGQCLHLDLNPTTDWPVLVVCICYIITYICQYNTKKNIIAFNFEYYFLFTDTWWRRRSMTSFRQCQWLCFYQRDLNRDTDRQWTLNTIYFPKPFDLCT